MRSGAHWRVHTSLQEATPVQFQPVLTMEKGNSGGLDLLIFSRCCALGLGVRLPTLYILVTKETLLKTLHFVFSDCGREEVEGRRSWTTSVVDQRVAS